MNVEDSMTEVPDLEYAKLVLTTNLTGTMFFTKEILPFMSDKCRVVNVSSGLAALNLHPKIAQERFKDPNLS